MVKKLSCFLRDEDYEEEEMRESVQRVYLFTLSLDLLYTFLVIGNRNLINLSSTTLCNAFFYLSTLFFFPF